MTKQEFYDKFNKQRKDFLNTTIKEFEKKYNKEYQKLFKELNYNIKNKIKNYSDEGNIRSKYLSKIKKGIDEEIIRFNEEWNTQHKELLERASLNAFKDTKEIYNNFNLDYLKDIKFNKNIVDYLINYKAQDGLNISDRLWGHSKSIRDKMFNKIRSNILMRESAWNTILDIQNMNNPNIEIPKYLKEQLKLMSDKEVNEVIDLYTVKKTNYLTRRLVEAETERPIELLIKNLVKIKNG